MAKIELRVATLEAKVEQLQRKLEVVAPENKPWWKHLVGACADRISAGRFVYEAQA